MDEVTYLKENYLSLKYEEIGKILDRSCISIERKVGSLGLQRREYKPKFKSGTKPKEKNEIAKKLRWTKEDENFLIENYDLLEVNELSSYLNRTPNSVLKKIKRLADNKSLIPKQKRCRNEEWKINFIVKNFFILDRKEIAHITNLTEDQVYHIARYRGLKATDREYKKYSEDEISILKDNWSDRNIKNIIKLLPNRTERSIISKASHLGLFCDKTLANTACDGSILDSGEEKALYEFIKFNLDIEVKPIGRGRKLKMHNEKYDEDYYPDFIAYNVSRKPLIIEYYGFICNEAYNLKISRKNEYYESLRDYDFIALYPKDLKKQF